MGGAALVMTEASAVEEIGRITPTDAGISLDARVESWRPTLKFLKRREQSPGCDGPMRDSKPSAGCAVARRWAHRNERDGWTPVSSTRFHSRMAIRWPRAFALADSDGVVDDARRARGAPSPRVCSWWRFTPHTAICYTALTALAMIKNAVVGEFDLTTSFSYISLHTITKFSAEIYTTGPRCCHQLERG